MSDDSKMVNSPTTDGEAFESVRVAGAADMSADAEAPGAPMMATEALGTPASGAAAPSSTAPAVTPVTPATAAAGESPAKQRRKNGSSHAGAHAKKGQSAYINKSTRMRKVLIAVSILLVALMVALGVIVFQLVTTAQNAAVQQTNASDDAEVIEQENSDSDSRTAVKKTTVPDLVPLLGTTLEVALEQVGHGAEVTRSFEVNEEGNPIKQDVQLTLTEEPSDSRAGTPTVYLGLGEDGAVLQVGYSAAMSALGYGTLSFSDAVTNEHVVEETLGEAGLSVSYGSAVLPDSKAEYSTYDTDGTTLVKEYCTFNGTGTAAEVAYQWESILSYDYSMANATDNLNDTIRTIYIYISQ